MMMAMMTTAAEPHDTYESKGSFISFALSPFIS